MYLIKNPIKRRFLYKHLFNFSLTNNDRVFRNKSCEKSKCFLRFCVMFVISSIPFPIPKTHSEHPIGDRTGRSGCDALLEEIASNEKAIE
ncbi:unnamed protein product [Debaryomyces tyrocola]|nr:unnamed protein product [Debaryomyces tyrocola]